MAEAIGKGADARGTLALRRVSDSREEGLQPSLLVTGRQRDAVSEHRGLSSGVASGKSVGVTEPTVGWKRAPLSVVAHTSGVISDKCFIYCILKFISYIYIYMLIEL
jgi:hypothetical protein